MCKSKKRKYPDNFRKKGKKDEEPIFECVYNGPEFFDDERLNRPAVIFVDENGQPIEGKNAAETKKESPDSDADRIPFDPNEICMPVYAGPEYFNPDRSSEDSE